MCFVYKVSLVPEPEKNIWNFMQLIKVCYVCVMFFFKNMTALQINHFYLKFWGKGVRYIVA